MKNEETEGNIDSGDIKEIKQRIKERETGLPEYRGQRFLTKQEIKENRRRVMELLERSGDEIARRRKYGDFF